MLILNLTLLALHSSCPSVHYKKQTKELAQSTIQRCTHKLHRHKTKASSG